MCHPPIFCQMKDLMKIHNGGKFHIYRICGCEVINFQIFSWRCSFHFGHFGVFLSPNSPKCSQILFKIGTVMETNILHHIYYGFWYSAENFKKLTQKPHFVVGIENFLDPTLFCPLGDIPIFGQMKGLLEIHNRGKFHWYSICGCQVIYLQIFSYHQKAAFLAVFGWFLVDYRTKSSLIYTKLSPVMQCKAKYNICYSFWYSPENTKKWSQKSDFLAFFSEVFWPRPPTPYGWRPNLLPNERSHEDTQSW